MSRALITVEIAEISFFACSHSHQRFLCDKKRSFPFLVNNAGHRMLVDVKKYWISSFSWRDSISSALECKFYSLSADVDVSYLCYYLCVSLLECLYDIAEILVSIFYRICED